MTDANMIVMLREALEAACDLLDYCGYVDTIDKALKDSEERVNEIKALSFLT